VEQLTELARKGRAAYIRRWLGRDIEAVIEAPPAKAGFVPALSENYLKLRIKCGEEAAPVPGSLVQCRILKPASGPHDASASAIFNEF
jgi:tRNA A37 methylthiotransferase MiaB